MSNVHPIIVGGNNKREYNPFQDCIPATEMSGRYFIADGEIYFVKEYYQSINRGGLDVEGYIYVDGQLIMED